MEDRPIRGLACPQRAGSSLRIHRSRQASNRASPLRHVLNSRESYCSSRRPSQSLRPDEIQRREGQVPSPRHPQIAQAISFSKKYLNRSLRESRFCISHSQTSRIDQPAFRRDLLTLRSLKRLPSSLARQNSMRLFGSLASLHVAFLCLCQKQPWTRIILRNREKTRSGLPGRSFTCNRYRKPIECTIRRTINSGPVSVPLMRAILSLRPCRVSVSTIWSMMPPPDPPTKPFWVLQPPNPTPHPKPPPHAAAALPSTAHLHTDAPADAADSGPHPTAATTR